MKGVPIPHLAKESTGAGALLLSKPTVFHQPKIGERYWERQAEQIPENRE